jgi:hypothetical protein
VSEPETVNQGDEEEAAKQQLVKMVGHDNKEYLNVMAELICSEDLLKASVASPPSTAASATQTKYKVIREFG